MRNLFVVACTSVCISATAAIVTVGPWTPVYKGIELASGQQVPEISGERYHQVLCYRVDLQDPDIKLFTTPRCTNSCGQEVLVQNTSHFLEQFSLQVAINGAFYLSSMGGQDETVGTPESVRGLAISLGTVVSPADDSFAPASILLTTNNQPVLIPNNGPPGTNTAGIYTAISGNYVLLNNGVNVGIVNNSDLDPRTAIGFSQDKRYLFLMTIDGRQGLAQGVNPPWSDGADFYNTGEWLKRFGAWDAINVDGGGSTTMVMANCEGKSVRLNKPSFVAAYGRERNVGHNFGVYAKPLPSEIKDLSIRPDSTTATLTWRTEVPTTAQVEYGPTAAYGSSTPIDGRLLKNHAVTLQNLAQGSNYFVRIISTTGGQTFTQACSFTTTRALQTTRVFGITNSWKYSTNNFDGVNWKTNGFNDSTWSGGPGLLYVQENVATVAPRSTVMPPLSGAIPRTYYFRTSFNFTGDTAGVSLTFSNYIDDGAVFHLNGTEIYRLRMAAAPTLITYTTAAIGSPCAGQLNQGDANTNCPDFFTVSGPVIVTNLLQGTNCLAVEVHNGSAGSDLVFGSALFLNKPVINSPQLTAWLEDGHGTVFWNGAGFTLQRSTDLSSPTNWVNVPGPVTQSPLFLTNGQSFFYRLKN